MNRQISRQRNGCARTGVLAVAALLCVCAGGLQAQTAWPSASDGAWDDAGKWSAGVPSGNPARLTASGANYEVAYTNGGAAFAGLLVTNSSGFTTTLRITAPDFQGNLAADRSIDLGRGAKAIVGPGGVWNLGGSNSSASAYLMNIANGGELRVEGGAFVSTNLAVNHSSRLYVNVGRLSSGSMTLDGGKMTMTNWGAYYPQINVGSGAGGSGTLDVKSGTLYMRNSLYCFNVANDVGSTGVVNQTGGTMDLTGVRISVGYNFGRGELNISGNSAWTNETLTIGNSRGYGRMNINGGIVQHSASVVLGDAGGTGVLYQTAGVHRSGGFTLARNTAAAPAPARGSAVIDGGANATTADGIKIGWTVATSGYDAYGLMIVSNGALSATGIYGVEQYTWYPHQGILLGYGALSGPMARGELQLAGGVVTNEGQFILGLYQTGTGTYWQTGGTYRHTGAGSTKRHVVVGYCGGSGAAEVSGGNFIVQQANLYLGGGPFTNKYVWPSVAPATGTFTMRGGTVAVSNDVILSYAGAGTLTIGKAGTFTAKNLDLTNGVATLRFEFGDGGIGVCKATTQMLVGVNSKLEIHVAGAVAGIRYKLVECGSRSGSFAPGNITVLGGDPSWVDQTSDQNIYLRVPSGTVITIL